MGIGKPVDPSVWITSEFFCGPIARDLYPFWREKFIEIFSCDNVSEVILYGSIGGGKTYFANVLLLYKLYQLAHLGDDIWKELGLAEGSSIFFIYFSVSMRQAFFGGYQSFLDLVDRIPFFKLFFPRDQSVKSFAKFPRNIFVIPGSRFQHQLGLNVLGAVLDEGNFRLARDAFEDAFNLYSVLTLRRMSRFMKYGKDLGLSVLVSSALEPTSFVEKRIKEAERSKSAIVVRVRGYEVKSHAIGKDAKYFVVFVGYGTVPPKVILTIEDLNMVLRQLGLRGLPEDESLSLVELAKRLNDEFSQEIFIPVPEVYKSVFLENTIQAIRDVLGVSVTSENKFLQGAILDKVIEGENCFISDVVQLSIHDGIELWEYFDVRRVKRTDYGRYIHVDLALRRDRVGIACVVLDGTVVRDEARLPVFRVEWVVGIERCTRYRIEDEIPIWKVRNFIRWLRDKAEVPIAKVTFDQYQSADTLQLLRQEGFDVDIISVDRTDEAYLNLLNLILERRVKICRCELLVKELLGLEWDKDRRKIDHPVSGTKDVADAVAGALFTASKSFNIGVVNLEEFAEKENRKATWDDWVLDQILSSVKKRRSRLFDSGLF